MATIQIPSITDEVLDFLANSPTPQEILDFKSSEDMQERLRYLLDKNRNSGLAPEENAELDEMERMNHFVIMLKARIRKKMAAK